MSFIGDVPQINERKLHILEQGKKPSRRRSNASVYATIGSEIKCDQEIFDSYSYEGWQDIHHDLLILCAAVEYADRRWARGVRQWARHIYVSVPVLELATWLDAHVQQHLHATLRHLTGDEWRFSFVQWGGARSSQSSRRNSQSPTAMAWIHGACRDCSTRTMLLSACVWRNTNSACAKTKSRLTGFHST